MPLTIFSGYASECGVDRPPQSIVVIILPLHIILISIIGIKYLEVVDDAPILLPGREIGVLV